MKPFVLNQQRCPQAHRAGCFRMSALGTGAADLRRTDRISRPEQGNLHAYNQFRCRIASRFFTMLIPFSISSGLILWRLSMRAERIASLTIILISDPEKPSVWAARRW